MARPRSLQQPFRKGMLLVGGGWRGYFAPYNAELAATTSDTSIGPTILDLQVDGPFDEDNMPSGYTDLGWITKFKITPASKIGLVRSGYRGAVRAIYRGEVGETFECTFRESSRMAWKISTGTEMFNLLKSTASASTVGPLSSSGISAVPMGASGYQSSFTVSGAQVPVLFVPSGSGAAFPAGSYIVCDIDFDPSLSGLVGPAGIPVWPSTVSDVDFIRKTSDFVARVKSMVPGLISGQDGLVLSEPFVGGGNDPLGMIASGPGTGAKVQAVKGFVAREGGTYVTEWSALFVMDLMDTSQIVLYYPHIAPNQFRDLANWQIENIGTTDMTGYELDAVFQALAFDDPIDGETVVRYCAYYPAPGKDLQI